MGKVRLAGTRNAACWWGATTPVSVSATVPSSPWTWWRISRPCPFAGPGAPLTSLWLNLKSEINWKVTQRKKGKEKKKKAICLNWLNKGSDKQQCYRTSVHQQHVQGKGRTLTGLTNLNCLGTAPWMSCQGLCNRKRSISASQYLVLANFKT